MNCFLSPHSQVVSAAAQTLEVLYPDTFLYLDILGFVGGSDMGLGDCKGVVCPLCAYEAGRSLVQQVSHFSCFPLQTLLRECIAPHMEDIGTVSASAPAPAAYLCKMFK